MSSCYTQKFVIDKRGQTGIAKTSRDIYIISGLLPIKQTPTPVGVERLYLKQVLIP